MVKFSQVLLGFQLMWSFTNIIAGNVARYDNYRFYEVTPLSDKHLQLLKDIELHSDSYKFIVEARRVNTSVAIIVAPQKFAEFSFMLNDQKMIYRIVTDDVQTLIDDELLTLSRRTESFGWNSYYPLESINQWMDSILEKYPNITSAISAGKSYEEREIRGVKISYKTGNPGIFIEGGIHAREWISPAVVTFIINSLLSSEDESIRNIAENFDWYIVPNVNPDGYVYTHTTDRLWRKTRQPYGSCFGADPNRNWNFHWAEAGASQYPCSETYAGSKAFSEIEMQTYADYLATLKNKIQTFIAFHSYSQLILFPYGHTSEKVKNFDDLMDIGIFSAQALAKRYSTKYTVGNIYDTIYPASGGSMDFVYGVLSVPVTYTYELRPASSFNGFELPTSEIIPTSVETVDSIVALIEKAKSLGYYKL